MITGSTRGFSADALLGACFALLTASCLVPPPAAKNAGPDGSTGGSGDTTSSGPAPHVTVPVPVEGPREFSHTSTELLKGLDLGWNLGNSLDVPEGETAWGNPKTTPEFMKAVAKAGFHLVRIPVTWSKHTGPAPDYVIDKAFLERVNEVVGYAHKAGLYAVIDTHHDGADGFKGVQWIALKDDKGQTTDANNAAVRTRFVKVWTQIAGYFSKYGEELLFESMNEIHDGYGEPDPRHFAIINDLNQEFVKLVRASGGNNDKRHLIVPGYNTNIDHTIKGFTLPKDPTQNRLILSVHFYDPYLFALMAEKHTWGKGAPGADNWGQEDHVTAQFDKLKATFIDKGTPVIMGEYGATNQAEYEDYRRYYMEYVTKAAKDRGILPVYWDNGGSGSGGEKFGMFNRNTGEVLHPKILEAMLRGATLDYTLDKIVAAKPSK